MATNPYTPGAAHAPPYLAGRDAERREFARLLRQTRILENLLLTGIRGIGKTVLLREALQKDAFESGWLWVGSDISEGVSASEENLVKRVLVDLNTFSGDWEYDSQAQQSAGFTGGVKRESMRFGYNSMLALFQHEPGLTADKLKKVLLAAWELMQKHMPKKKGIIFAWDEAHNLADRSADDQYPLGVLLDVFTSLQSQGVPFMLALSGLPTLFPTLVKSRAYAERMFRVMTLGNLSMQETREAVRKPLQKITESKDEDDLSEKILTMFTKLILWMNPGEIYNLSKGYPYFIQFWCREIYDYGVNAEPDGETETGVYKRIARKLDTDFFEARWSNLSDRQRDLLCVIARLDNSGGEFSVQEIVNMSQKTKHAFSNSHVNQMLTALYEKGMVFKNRRGKYVLALPLLDEYILRRMSGDGLSLSA